MLKSDNAPGNSEKYRDALPGASASVWARNLPRGFATRMSVQARIASGWACHPVTRLILSGLITLAGYTVLGKRAEALHTAAVGTLAEMTISRQENALSPASAELSLV